MIVRSPLRCLCATLIAFIFSAIPAAAQQHWQAPAGNGGAWTIAGTNWANAPAGPANVAWNNGGTTVANFGTLGGVVDINYPSDVRLAGVIFSVSNYTINSTSGVLEFQAVSSEINTGAFDATINAVIADSGSVGFAKTGAGTLTLGGVNIHQATRINAGTLSISQDRNLGTNLGAPNLLFNGGTLLATSSFSIINNRTTTLLAGGGTISVASGQTLTMGGVIQNTGPFTKSGPGTLVLTGANTYTGVTTLAGGILSTNVLADGGVISGIGAATNAAANLVLNGGTLRYTGGGATTNRLFTLGLNGGTIEANGSALLNLSNGGAIAFTGTGTRTLTLAGTNTNTNVFAPIIGNEGANATSLVKNGASIWRLNGANTYTGTTTVNGGTLRINGSLAAGSAVTVNSGATLRADAAGTVNGAVTVNTGGTLHGTGTVAGAVLMAGPGTLIGGSRSGPVGGQGTLTIGGGLTMADGNTIGIRIFDSSTPAAIDTGGSTMGGTPNPSSNNFINVTGGGLAANPAGINFAIDLTDRFFTNQLTYSYQIGTVVGVDLDFVVISNPSQFSVTGLTAPSATYSVTGGPAGQLYLNISPVPEPATVLGIAAGALGAGGYIRRRVLRRA